VALLQELLLLDRRFTWSNWRDSLMLVRLDRAFVNAELGIMLFNSRLESLPRPVSDHVPLVITVRFAAG
jgi:endonuclease/exonuclease/phosphatase family metal-dependent hydrolase